MSFKLEQEQYESIVSQMHLTEDEKKDPENNARVMNVLQWMANSEKEETSNDLKTHIIREELISLGSNRPESEFNDLHCNITTS